MDDEKLKELFAKLKNLFSEHPELGDHMVACMYDYVLTERRIDQERLESEVEI